MEGTLERPKLDGVNFQKISSHDNSVLIANFKEDEVKDIVCDCASSKSLGPDGFTFLFIKEFWELLKENIKRFLSKFHCFGVLLKGLNSSFIALIAKCENHKTLVILGQYLW